MSDQPIIDLSTLVKDKQTLEENLRSLLNEFEDKYHAKIRFIIAGDKCFLKANNDTKNLPDYKTFVVKTEIHLQKDNALVIIDKI